MAGLCFVTRRYTGQDWNDPDENGTLYLSTSNQMDVIHYDRPIRLNSVVVGIKSFYFAKKGNSSTSFMGCGLEIVPNAYNDNNDNKGTVVIKPYIRLRGQDVVPIIPAPLDPPYRQIIVDSVDRGSSFLELNITVSYE